MIVGKDWVWLHFPKCGGTSAEALLQLNFGNDPEVAFDPIDPENVIWHDSISKRKARNPEQNLSGHRILLLFRRLPDWLLSRVHYEAGRKPYRIATREMIETGRFYENAGRINRADAVFRNFNTPPADHLVPVEKMHEGFEAFFGRSLKPLEEQKNKNRFPYLRDISFWFTPAQLEELYHANPLWAEAEKRVYGDLRV